MARYVLKDGDEGLCPRGHPLKLLTHGVMPDGYPAFLICFRCEDVTEVEGDDGHVIQYKRGRRKKFLRPKTKKEAKDERPLRQSSRRHRPNRR